MGCTEEKGLQRLLANLEAQPLAEERKEFGLMLMRNIDALTPEEIKRYEELKEILTKEG